MKHKTSSELMRKVLRENDKGFNQFLSQQMSPDSTQQKKSPTRVKIKEIPPKRSDTEEVIEYLKQ